MTAAVLRADARHLPLPDASVDLIVTSPPYFGLRAYSDEGYCAECRIMREQGRDPKQAWPDYGAHWQEVHAPRPYDGQIGSEATPREWLAAMLECTAEWVRVLKPSGSIFVNLGDKYAAGHGGSSTEGNGVNLTKRVWENSDSDGSGSGHGNGHQSTTPRVVIPGTRPKSLLGLPWRYALACMDDLGLILRRDIIWHKKNGLPESVTDRCRSSHEYVFHLVKQPRYYAAVDEIREPHTGGTHARRKDGQHSPKELATIGTGFRRGYFPEDRENPLGKLPGSVWDIPSQPLTVPDWLGVDHFACVDAETEILTPRGWLRHDQLTEGDQVAGYDLDSNMARWTECSAVSRYDYDGDLIAVESRDISMRLTPNHRAVVQRMDAYTKRRNPVSVVRADELDRYHFIPRSAAWESLGDFYIGDRLAALFGWIAAEGWYQGKRVYLSQSLEVNPAGVAEIDQLAPDAKRVERKRDWRGRPWTEVQWTLGPVAALIQREMPDKLLPWWLVMATEPERRAVLDAFIDGDGHRRPDGRIGIFQKHRHNLDVLQAIAVTLGYKTTLREGGGRFVLYLTEGGRSITLRGTSAVGTPGAGSKVKREHYKGTVWCPATGTGTFIARRNGSVFVTGNSFPMELPRRCILGWSPPGICVVCGEGRRPVTIGENIPHATRSAESQAFAASGSAAGRSGFTRDVRWMGERRTTITGYACACPDATAPTRPAVVADPFGGTGTTSLVASMYGRLGLSFDLSADYCRLARWRTRDPAERAKAAQVPKPPPVPDGQGDLFGGLELAP